ncbi:MAG: hypothetical protein SCH71_11500 [Desulfobulbaceae bacterium]|nr:hypothetical protein [Desulfobulbaceae bacterium]
MKWVGHRTRNIFPAARLSLMMMPCLFFAALPGQASSTITATYLHSGGKSQSIRIEVGSPPPSSLILIQKLPPGTNILRSEPPAQKVDPGAGEAKWLFRNLNPGVIIVSFSVDREISAAEISGQIRFKSPGGEGMKSLPVNKP